MESWFDIAYLIGVITLGIVMITKSKGNSPKRLYGAMAIILGAGDAFHLIPRVSALITNSIEESAAALGFGTLVTSITMTVFYVMLYHFWCDRYQKSTKSPLTLIVYALAVCRVALCLLPQNNWLSPDAPLSWGIYRNIPFVILGVIIVILLKKTKAAKGESFGLAWLAVLLSFLFYIPVVLFADAVPAIGMLMIPKTICYVWLVSMGFRSFGKKTGSDGKTM